MIKNKLINLILDIQIWYLVLVIRYYLWKSNNKGETK